MSYKFYTRRSYDEELVKQLHKATFPSDEWYEHKGNIYWITWNEKKEPVAFAIFTDIGEKIGFLSRAGVLREFRGKGLQKRLIKVRVNYAIRNNFKSLITYVDIDNVASARSLLSQGFELYRPEWYYVGRNFNYFRMVL